MADAVMCRVDLNHGRKVLSCRPGLTLFAALRINKMYLPTGCGARGRCGQCRVKVLAGDANPPTDSEIAIIPEADRAAGFRLGCQLRLSGDLETEVPEAVFQAGEYAATLEAAIPLTHDIRRFVFAPEPGIRIPHQAGQFLNLATKLPEGGGQVVRCFSFATPSRVEDKVEIIVRLNPKGVMTPHLFGQAKPGDRFSIFAPFGEFILREGNAPCIWIAGGSGLSPFLGMLQDLIDRGSERPVHLFFGAVEPGDLYYTDYFQEISQKHPWFSFTPALSGKGRCEACREYGLITDVVARYIADPAQAEGYICGSPGMIKACIAVLVGKGMDHARIYFDRFS